MRIIFIDVFIAYIMTLEQYFCQRHKLMWKKFWCVFLCYLIKRFFADLPDIQMGIVNQYMCVIFFVGMKQAVKDDRQIMISGSVELPAASFHSVCN